MCHDLNKVWGCNYIQYVLNSYVTIIYAQIHKKMSEHLSANIKILPIATKMSIFWSITSPNILITFLMPTGVYFFHRTIVVTM